MAGKALKASGKRVMKYSRDGAVERDLAESSEQSMAVPFASGYFFSSSPAFLPPPHLRSAIISGAIVFRCDNPQSAIFACPEFIPFSIIFPSFPSGFLV